MDEFEAKVKKWGNSLGFTIPNEIAKRRKLKPDTQIRILLLESEPNPLRSVFGKFKTKKSTQQIMEEIDEGWD